LSKQASKTFEVAEVPKVPIRSIQRLYNPFMTLSVTVSTVFMQDVNVQTELDAAKIENMVQMFGEAIIELKSQLTMKIVIFCKNCVPTRLL
jgi:hypothetical protein